MYGGGGGGVGGWRGGQGVEGLKANAWQMVVTYCMTKQLCLCQGGSRGGGGRGHDLI